jgi:hypothetical protein
MKKKRSAVSSVTQPSEENIVNDTTPGEHFK